MGCFGLLPGVLVGGGCGGGWGCIGLSEDPLRIGCVAMRVSVRRSCGLRRARLCRLRRAGWRSGYLGECLVPMARRSRELERVSGELVEREVVARPVAPTTSEQVSPAVIYVQQPVAPVFEPTPVRRHGVPLWMIVLGYFAGVIGIILLVLALSSGPLIQPPHTPTTQHERSTR
jgi:hypothetical protein